MKGGRPFRFLVVALGTWAGIRAAILLPGIAPGPAIVRFFAPEPASAVPRSARDDGPAGQPARRASAVSIVRVAGLHRESRPAQPRVVIERRPAVAAATPPLSGAPRPAPVQTDPMLRVLPAVRPVSPERSRVAASAWLLARGGPAGTLSGGQLGASQAGLRVTYALGEARKVSLAARLAAPLAGRGREAAVGLEWQPTRLPVRFVAEQRFVLDGGRGGPTLGVIAGYGPGEIARGVRLEAYGQAGAIARAGIEAYADAAARLTHPVLQRRGIVLDGGLGVWCSAQRDAERLDVGPTLGAAVPLGGRSIRVALDWRARIGGRARPGSGPALSIGSDF